MTRDKPSLLPEPVVVSSTALTKPAFCSVLTKLLLSLLVSDPLAISPDAFVMVVGWPLTVKPGSSWDLSRNGASDEVVAAPTGPPKRTGKLSPPNTRAPHMPVTRRRAVARARYDTVTATTPVNWTRSAGLPLP